MSEERVAAKRTDWTIEEMPFRRKHFQLERTFTEEEMQELRYGNIPKDMDDKWFWYMEGNILYAHRSWTGVCIFMVEFNENTGIHKVTVNRNKKQYPGKDIKEDMDLVSSLLNMWVKPVL